MKLDKIFTMFKKREHLSLYNKLYKDNNGETKIAMQYLSDGGSCYPLTNLPICDGNNVIYGLLGLEPKKSHMNCFVDYAPEWLEAALADFNDSDIPLKAVTDIFGYTVLETYHNSDNDNFPEVCYFLAPQYLAPLSDENYDLISRSVTINKINTRAIIAKAGLITKAILLPYLFNSFDCETNLKILENAFEELQKQNRRNKIDAGDCNNVML